VLAGDYPGESVGGKIHYYFRGENVRSVLAVRGPGRPANEDYLLGLYLRARTNEEMTRAYLSTVVE
jgi:hypothetical protein